MIKLVIKYTFKKEAVKKSVQWSNAPMVISTHSHPGTHGWIQNIFKGGGGLKMN